MIGEVRNFVRKSSTKNQNNPIDKVGVLKGELLHVFRFFLISHCICIVYLLTVILIPKVYIYKTHLDSNTIKQREIITITHC